jgi:dihydrofolate reductase
VLSPPLFAIFALGRNDALGRGGALPWSYPEDATYFDVVTRGHAVIMGRRTWDERGKPLPDRHNIVVSRTLGDAKGAHVVPRLEDALAVARALDETPFVIGGAVLFEAAMPKVTRVYLTRIPESPEADTFLHFDPSPFEVISSRKTESGLEFSVLQRRDVKDERGSREAE